MAEFCDSGGLSGAVPRFTASGTVIQKLWRIFCVAADAAEALVRTFEFMAFLPVFYENFTG